MYNTVHMYINVKCIYIYRDCVCDSGNSINSDQCGCRGSMDICGIYGIVHPDNDSLEGGQQPLTKKFQHAPEAPGHPVSMLPIITSQWPEQERLFFEGSAKRCFHTTLKLGDQGCLTVLARVQVGWLFFLRTRYCIINY